MADAPTIESVVDDLSKPENRAELEKSLNDAFKEATTPADDKTAAPDPGDNKDVKDEDDADKGEDPSKKDAGEGDKKPANRIEDLLADRNAAKKEAAEAQTEVQTLTKQVENLTKLVEKLSTGKPDERTGGDAGADDNAKGKTLAELVAEEVAKITQATNASADAEKSIVEGIQALNDKPEYPNAAKFQSELKRVMETYPGMKAAAAYGFLVGNGIIPSETAKSNANRTGTSGRSNTKLMNTKKPADMTQAESLAFLKEQEKAGALKGVI